MSTIWARPRSATNATAARTQNPVSPTWRVSQSDVCPLNAEAVTHRAETTTNKATRSVVIYRFLSECEEGVGSVCLGTFPRTRPPLRGDPRCWRTLLVDWVRIKASCVSMPPAVLRTSSGGRVVNSSSGSAMPVGVLCSNTSRRTGQPGESSFSTSRPRAFGFGLKPATGLLQPKYVSGGVPGP